MTTVKFFDFKNYIVKERRKQPLNKIHEFGKEFERGLRGEKLAEQILIEVGPELRKSALLTAYSYEHHPEKQKQGIDCSITFPKLDLQIKVRSSQFYHPNEIDFVLETISVDRTNKPGWFLTSKADFIFYFWWSNQFENKFSDGYVLKMEPLKAEFLKEIETENGKEFIPNEKLKRFPEKSSQNRGYKTYFRIVPLLAMSEFVISIKHGFYSTFQKYMENPIWTTSTRQMSFDDLHAIKKHV